MTEPGDGLDDTFVRDGPDDTLGAEAEPDTLLPDALHDTVAPSGPPSGVSVVGHADTFVRSGAEAPASAPRDLQVTEEHEGRYSGEREVGRGGLGRVAATYDRHLARQVAKKELLTAEQEAAQAGSGSQSQAVARFLREARVTAQLEHPNIVPVYELGRRDGGELYYTMKLVRGRTLKAAIAAADDMQDRLSLLSHFVDLCQAIAYAHSRGVIHRDIKPDNVMIGEFGETLVLDWGVAKLRGSEDLRGEELARAVARLRDEQSAQTLPGSAFGTPVYMAPEQAEGRIEHVDERSDVWALGVVLYQLLSGRIPYPNTHVFAVLVRAARADLVPIEHVCDDAPPELLAVVRRALAADPKDRYPSAKALAEDIEVFRAGGRVAAYRYSAREVLQRFLAEHRAAVTVSAVAGLLLLLVLAGAYLGLREERDRALAAEQDSRSHFAAALVERARVHERAHDWVGAELLAAAALAQSEQPQARGLLIASQVGLRPELAWSERTYAGCADIAYAADDEALFCATSFGVARFDATSGAQTARLETKGGWVRAVAVSDDGARLLAGGDGAEAILYQVAEPSELMKVRLQSPVLAASFLRGVPTVVTERGAVVRLVTSGSTLEAEVLHEGEVEVARAAAGPGAVVYADRDGRVVRFDVSGAVTFTPRGGPIGALAVSDDGRRIAIADEDRMVRLFDETGGAVGVIRDRGLSGVTALGFAGRALLAGSDEGEVHVIDVLGREVRARFVAHEGPVDHVASVRGGVLTAGRDRRVRRYRGELPASGRVALNHRLLAEARGIALAADGGQVALAGPGGLRVLSDQGPREVGETRFEAVALSMDGRWLAAGGAAGGLSWRERGVQGAGWTHIEPIAAPIAALAFDPGASQLFAVARGGALVRVDLSSPRATVSKARVASEPSAVAVGTTWLAVAEGPRISLATVEGAAQGHLPDLEADVSALAIAEAAGWLAAGDVDGTIFVWSVLDRGLVARFAAMAGGVRALAFTEAGTLLALGAYGAVAAYDLDPLTTPAIDLQRSLRQLRGVRLHGLRPVPR